MLIGLQALAAIADLTGLQALALGDCGAITNNGMAVLTALTQLTSLAIVRCPRIADKGLSILGSFPLLEALDVTGCVKVRGSFPRLLGLLRARFPVCACCCSIGALLETAKLTCNTHMSIMSCINVA